MHRKRFGLLCLLGVSCVDEGVSKDECLDEPGQLVLGTGESEWIPLDSGDGVTMVHGPQGGWHMLGSARVTGLGPAVEIHYTITDVASGVLISDNVYSEGFTMENTCTGIQIGMYGYLEVEALTNNPEVTPPEALSYHTVELAMTARNLGEKNATASMQVIAIPDPQEGN